MGAFRGKITGGGTLVLPADVDGEMSLAASSIVHLEIDGDGLRGQSAETVLRGIQEKLKSYGPAKPLASEELIEERRAGAAWD